MMKWKLLREEKSYPWEEFVWHSSWGYGHPSLTQSGQCRNAGYDRKYFHFEGGRKGLNARFWNADLHWDFKDVKVSNFSCETILTIVTFYVRFNVQALPRWETEFFFVWLFCFHGSYYKFEPVFFHLHHSLIREGARYGCNCIFQNHWRWRYKSAEYTCVLKVHAMLLRKFEALINGSMMSS